MSTLGLKTMQNIKKIASPAETKELTLKSNALEFFTDFLQITPLVIESNISAVETMTLMKKTHVRLKLVLDEEDNMVGIVSADDLLERKLMQKLGKSDKRADLSITDFMTPREKLKVLEYDELRNSSISDVINVLKNSGQQHCLVIDSKEELVRGLFSMSDISRKLKINIDIQDQPSFLKLANKLD